jgi:NRPS condensation-like uncharacterized protein
MEQQRDSTDHNPIVIAIPVNLRKQFPSKTLRNFFAVANIEMPIDAETIPSDIVKDITEQLKKKSNKSALQAFINENVSLEKKLYARFIPLLVKKHLIMIGSNILGESRKTITLSNLGSVSVPSGFSPHVHHLETILYPTPKSPINCAVCSMDDKLAITFSRTIAEADIIRAFFRLLADEGGVSVEVYSNEWGRECESMR